MSLSKYKWKLRILLVETPDYQDPKYKQTKDIYNNNLKEFHKRFVKMISRVKKNKPFQIHLIGFDGTTKHTYTKLNSKQVFDHIESMPMGSLRNKASPANLSLYADYNPDTTTPGLGFKDTDKALYTLKTIQNRPLKYQINVVNTMIGRAESHPNQTQGMRDAIEIFQAWKRVINS